MRPEQCGEGEGWRERGTEGQRDRGTEPEPEPEPKKVKAGESLGKKASGGKRVLPMGVRRQFQAEAGFTCVSSTWVIMKNQPLHTDNKVIPCTIAEMPKWSIVQKETV